MKYLSFLIILIFGCQYTERYDIAVGEQLPDTIVMTYDLNHELAGSAYRKRATGYALVIDGDTSQYRPSFTESKDGSVNLILGLHPAMTFSDQLNLLRRLLPYASMSYNLDSLKGIYVGRLVDTGELVIDITNEYLATYGDYGSTATSEYQNIARFLAQSKLGREINMLFQPYGLEVCEVSVEKVFFTDVHITMRTDNKISGDRKIPDQILDCMTWVRMMIKDTSRQPVKRSL